MCHRRRKAGNQGGTGVERQGNREAENQNVTGVEMKGTNEAWA